MLRTPTQFPDQGSYAVHTANPSKPLRIIQRNADGTLLVSGVHDCRGTTTRVDLSDLVPAPTKILPIDVQVALLAFQPEQIAA